MISALAISRIGSFGTLSFCPVWPGRPVSSHLEHKVKNQPKNPLREILLGEGRGVPIYDLTGMIVVTFKG